MNVNQETQAFIENSPAKTRKIISEIVDIFESQGCVSYVKTIYIGFEIDGEMVAALYAHEKYVEIALALDENCVDQRLKDATHLTWRTLPLCLELASDIAVKESTRLFEEACDRVRSSKHKVMRDNDFFVSGEKPHQRSHRRSTRK